MRGENNRFLLNSRSMPESGKQKIEFSPELLEWNFSAWKGKMSSKTTSTVTRECFIVRVVRAFKMSNSLIVNDQMFGQVHS